MLRGGTLFLNLTDYLYMVREVILKVIVDHDGDLY